MKFAKTYYVRKIYDRETARKMTESRLYGQSAVAFMPTGAFETALTLKKSGDEYAYNEWAKKAEWEDVWAKVMELKPKVGLPIFFVATKPDAGNWRCGIVEAVEFKDDYMLVTTKRSIYKIAEEKD